MAGTWLDRVRIKGHLTHIEELVGEPSKGYKLSIMGNGEEGWCAYLTGPEIEAIQVSPLFIPDIGETLNMLKEASGRHFSMSLRKSSSHHPF